jgi:hypothetical protein
VPATSHLGSGSEKLTTPSMPCPDQFKGTRKKVSLCVAWFLVGKHKASQLDTAPGGDRESTCEDGVRTWVRKNRDANQGAMAIKSDSKSHGRHGARVVMCDDEIAGGRVVRDFGDFVIRRPDGSRGGR